jgi:hypothetical protein
MAATLLAAFAGTAALAADGGAEAAFEQRCAQLARAATVEVAFEDAPIAWNTRYDEAQLRRMGSTTPSMEHSVLGLTVARPTARLTVKHASLVNPATSRVCIAGNVGLALGFAEMTVYLSSSLTNPCRRRIVEEHELEHVRLWRTHLRVGAQLARPLIEQRLRTPLYADDPEAAEKLLRQQVNEITAPILERISDAAHAAQRELDTPASYQAAANRLRACP